MITFEQKKIHNKLFYYLSDQIKVDKKFKKIQVFVGKTIPKNTASFYEALKQKERALVFTQFSSKYLNGQIIARIEKVRIDWKYYRAQLSKKQYEIAIRDFAIRFIFESNAIEGSKLSQDVVSAIIKKKYVKKSILRREVQEVLNSIKAFGFIQSTSFILNQKNIKKLHAIVTKDLSIQQGFKKESIIVNNKETTAPKKVRRELTGLITWYRQSKKDETPFTRAIIFHNRFEHIHPFEDGNGRTGRLLLNWMLLKSGYGVMLFKHRNRAAYMRALDKGDEGRYQNILRLSTVVYSRTINEIRGIC